MIIKCLTLSKCIQSCYGWWWIWGLWGLWGFGAETLECWLQCRARTGWVSNYDDTATLSALRKWTRFIFRSVMESAGSHHTDPDNDQARYRYKEIPGILLAFIIHLSCSRPAGQQSSNKPSSTALISSPQKSAYNALFGGTGEERREVLTRKVREEEEEEALLVSLLCRIMPANTISAWSDINPFRPWGEDNASESSHSSEPENN